jgi:hypothetical protein
MEYKVSICQNIFMNALASPEANITDVCLFVVSLAI